MMLGRGTMQRLWFSSGCLFESEATISAELAQCLVRYCAVYGEQVAGGAYIKLTANHNKTLTKHYSVFNTFNILLLYDIV